MLTMGFLGENKFWRYLTKMMQKYIFWVIWEMDIKGFSDFLQKVIEAKLKVELIELFWGNSCFLVLLELGKYKVFTGIIKIQGMELSWFFA